MSLFYTKNVDQIKDVSKPWMVFWKKLKISVDFMEGFLKLM
jgi:hypothetical protein